MRYLDKKYWKYPVIGLVLAIAVLIAGWNQLPDVGMHTWFLDVGQGDAILIQTPEGHNVLVDGGPKSNVMELLSDALPFFNREIDLMILTHPHADHLEGLTEVIKRYKVNAVLLTGVSYNNVYYDEFLRDIDRMINEGSLKFFIARADMDFKVGSVYFDVVYPTSSLAGREIGNLNNSSIVMRVSYKDNSGIWRRILLSGDCEAECEQEILSEKFDLKSEIYKAGHHGSKTASTLPYVKAIDPDISVIQCGEDNKFGHPHSETLRTFAKLGITQVLRTDIGGTIEMKF